MSDKLAKLIATFFYVGGIPKAPGTAASVVGCLIAVIFTNNLLLYILVTAIVIFLGFKVCSQVEASIGTNDPSCIVIDEVAGMLIALFLLPINGPILVTAFFLFRAFDMFKIYPVNKFEQLPGAQGIMWDDLFAGIYTNVAMHLAIRWAGVF
jgi:phosphatidylglycerophosphatase A